MSGRQSPRREAKPSNGAPDLRLAIEHMALGDLVPDPQNARLHSPGQLRSIARSIEAYGFLSPLLIDRANKVLAGHGRLAAARMAGLREVPVVRIEHLSPAQARAFAIADNRLAETSTWDERQLAIQLQELAGLDLDFDIEATGFTMGEIDLKIEVLATRAPRPIPPMSCHRPARRWPRAAMSGASATTGALRQRAGAEAYARLLWQERAAMTCTDPPYNVPINGHVSNLKGGKGRRHREFAMATGEMSEPEFTAFLTTVCRLHGANTARHGESALHLAWTGDTCSPCWPPAARSMTTCSTSACGPSRAAAWAGSIARPTSWSWCSSTATPPTRTMSSWASSGATAPTSGTTMAPPACATARTATSPPSTRRPSPCAMIADALLDVTARGDHRAGSLPGLGNHPDRRRAGGTALPRAGDRSAVRRSDHPPLAAADRRRRRPGSHRRDLRQPCAKGGDTMSNELRRRLRQAAAREPVQARTVGQSPGRKKGSKNIAHHASRRRWTRRW